LLVFRGHVGSENFGRHDGGTHTTERERERERERCLIPMACWKPDLWVEMTSDRDLLRAAMRKGETEFERAILTRMEDKQKRRKMPVSHQPDLPCSYCDSLCWSKRIKQILQCYLQIVCRKMKRAIYAEK
jgi:hypothetical protein